MEDMTVYISKAKNRRISHLNSSPENQGCAYWVYFYLIFCKKHFSLKEIWKRNTVGRPYPVVFVSMTQKLATDQNSIVFHFTLHFLEISINKEFWCYVEQPSHQLPEDITSLMYWHHKFFSSRSFAISLLYFSLPSLTIHMYLGIAV